MFWIHGFIPLTNGSGSGFGSCSSRQWPSRGQQKTNLKKSFSAHYFLKVHLHHFSKIKSQKEVTKQQESRFSYYFCLMIEGSWFIPLTIWSGSGSRRPKNIRIRRIWIRTRIRNTGILWNGWFDRYSTVLFEPRLFIILITNDFVAKLCNKVGSEGPYPLGPKHYFCLTTYGNSCYTRVKLFKYIWLFLPMKGGSIDPVPWKNG